MMCSVALTSVVNDRVSYVLVKLALVCGLVSNNATRLVSGETQIDGGTNLDITSALRRLPVTESICS